MRVVLTEKSSVATLIATALGGRRNGQWYSATWRGQPLTIAYASGHLFEELSPSEIVPTMNWTDPSSLLPVPYRIGLKKKVPKEKNDQARIAALIGGLMQLIPQATDMILATDADREGEAIGRTILKAAKFDKGFRRLWLAGGMDQQSILNALDNLKPSTFTDGMYQAQQARSVADWQSQITTRALTIQARCQLMGAHLGQGSGPSSAVSCGRVQSPTLYMVWDRDQRIQNFVPMAYFQPAIYVTQEGLTAAQYAVESDDEEDDNTLTDSNRAEGFRLTYRWPKVAAYPAVIPGTQWDESPRKPGTYSLRFTDAQMATNYERTLAAFVGQSTELRVESKKSLRHPPKPFSLTTAGVYLNKKHRMKTAQADEAIADLYLKGHVSYPRTEAQELPLSEYPAARGILEAVAAVPGMEAAANAPCVIDPNAKVPGCYTSKEDMPHPALSPTASIPDLNALTANERHAYLAICQRYIEAHYPPAELDRVLVWTSVGSPGLLGEGRPVFGQTGNRVTSPGWLAAFDTPYKDTIPPLSAGPAQVAGVSTLQGKTTPPPRFTEATLLEAMFDAARYAPDKTAASILKESQGIGTPATRSAAIETLKKREYIEVFAIGKGKEAVEYLRCTPKGNDFIRLGPKQMFSVLMTAEWEAELRKMDSLSHAEAFEMRKTFVLRNTQMVTQIVTDVVSALAAAGLSQAPQHGANNAPTARQIAFARDLAASLDKPLPPDCETSFAVCQAFLRDNAIVRPGSDKGTVGITSEGPPTPNQLKFAEFIAKTVNVPIPDAARTKSSEMRAYIEKHKSKLPPREGSSYVALDRNGKPRSPKTKSAGAARR